MNTQTCRRKPASFDDPSRSLRSGRPSARTPVIERPVPHPPAQDAVRKLDWAERWVHDSFQILESPGLLGTLEIDMSIAQDLLQDIRSRGVHASYTHVFVRAAAIVLQRCPDLHRLMNDTLEFTPGRVDIGLSVSGSGAAAPVLVIEDAANKSVMDIAREVEAGTPEVRKEQEARLLKLRKRGHWIPFGFLRRRLFKQALRKFAFRRKIAGTFQVTCLPVADCAVPLAFVASAALGVGRVRDRVIAVDGKPQVRPTAIITVVADHKVWNGMMAARFAAMIAKVLTSPGFA